MFTENTSDEITATAPTVPHAPAAQHGNKLPDYVVAVGASAGGLDALEKFFTHFPPDSGAAFVVIQHLSADHKSIMDSLLARHTRMPVRTVTDHMAMESNAVYLIPPGSTMHMEGHEFLLTPKPPRTLSLPVDVFFQSLASNFKEKSIAVVLSGTGSDGTRGAGAINEAGGLLIAQDPDSAKFDGMPRSVISTGLVDAILPVEAMAQRIYAHIKSLGASSLPLNSQSETAPAQGAYDSVLELLRKHGGINFADYKPGTVTRRIERRMAVRQISTMLQYLDLLQEDHTEIMTLRRELLIPVTSFFRDPEAYETLKQQVVNHLLSSKQTDQGVRIWCAGIASGEEAYSIAMLFSEAFEVAKRWPAIKIFATDIEQHNIDIAGAGVYPESIMAEVSAEQLERFFTKRGNQFVVKNDLRQRIVFAKHNLLSDPPFTKMDLIVCRNVLIYFNNEAQQHVLRRFQYALKPNSFLFLGSSESLGALNSDFFPVASRQKIWKIIKPSRFPLNTEKRGHGTWLPAEQYLQNIRPSADWENRSLPQTIGQLGYATLIQAFSPPTAILVGPTHEMLHAYGDVSRYLKIRAGNATLDITKILPTPLIPVAAALLFKSARELSSTISDIIRVHLDEENNNLLTSVRLSAWPVLQNTADNHPKQPQLTLLVFEEVNESQSKSNLLAVNADVALETTERMEVLQNELTATRESLQATIEELETSNEELQATNEEMMASNEELQSSNEELQSVNEELNTVNAEYQEKIEILNRVNADLDNLSKVVASGTIFIDQHQNITRFSPDAVKIFKLRGSDIGRPLSDISHILNYSELSSDLSSSLASGQMFERYLSSADGAQYLLKMLPYRISSSAESGLVITFVEISALRKASKLQELLDASFESLAVVDYDGKLVITNNAWLQKNTQGNLFNLTAAKVNENYIDFCKQHLATTPWAQSVHHELGKLISHSTDEFKLEFDEGKILLLGKCMSPENDSILIQVITKE